MPTLPQILEMLDRDGALELGDAPDVWPTLEPNDDVYEVDWGRLFPRRVLDRGAEDWDLYGDDGWTLSPDLLDRLRSGGSPSAEQQVEPPGWDRCAWYQPIHFHGPEWGIFLYDECIVDLAAHLCLKMGRPPLTDTLAKTLLRAAFASLFLHEQYHHKTESLALRLHVVERLPKYVPYFRGVYVPAAGSDDQIEEGLANADSYHRLDDPPYSNWLALSIRRLTKEYLVESFRASLPGYRLAAGLLDVDDFDMLENQLKAQVQEAALKPARPRPDDFALATHLNQSMFSIRQNVWAIAVKGSTPLLPVKPRWIAPLSRSSLEKFLVAEGYRIQRGRGKGSHTVYAKAGAPMVVLPERKDLSLPVLRNTAHAVGLRNVNELIASVGK